MRTRRKKARAIMGIVATVCLIAAFGGALYLFEHIWGDDEWIDGSSEEEENTILYFGDDEYEITHNIESYLIIGTDDSGDVEKEGSEGYEGQMADFLLLYIMDKTDNTYGFLQIDRNTITEVPLMDREGNGEGTATEQICTATWYGGSPEHGCNNVTFTVGELVGGLRIDGYYSVNMKDIGIINHSVDGVTLTLEEDFTKQDPAMKKGATLTLTDKQAEIYVRGRMDVSDGTNASRMQRQQQYMKAYMDKAKVKLGSDATFATELYEDLSDDAVTDILESRISVIANQMYKGEDLGIQKIEGETKLGTELNDGKVHEEFYPDIDSIASAMVLLCGIDEEHIDRYEDTGEDE